MVFNGREMEVRAGATVADLLDYLGLTGRPVAVEVNREVVPKNKHAQRVLAAGDRIEVVTLVGGG